MLDAACEATLLAGVWNSLQSGSNIMLLTLLLEGLRQRTGHEVNASWADLLGDLKRPGKHVAQDILVSQTIAHDHEPVPVVAFA